MVCEARRATTSEGLKPASANLARMAVTLSVGSGTVRSGAGPVGAGLPSKNGSRGAPGQFVIPTAAARWTLEFVNKLCMIQISESNLQVTCTQCANLLENRELVIGNIIDTTIGVWMC